MLDQPFITHRAHLDTYDAARRAGIDDTGYCELVAQLDRAVEAVDGVGFRTTPLLELPAVPGGGAAPVLAKVETANVAGSHKARHLFGLLVQIAIDEHEHPSDADRPLAIASCGNAALAAAVLARAVDRRLLVFVPLDANPAVLAELERLGADIQPCPRTPGQLGDPCLAELDGALGRGARPFTVQGPICPGVIDGGRTLGLELATQLADAGIAPTDLYVQIGGGALATAVVDGLARSGRLEMLPRLHPVQPTQAHPYVAAWQRIRSIMADEVGLDPVPDNDRRLAQLLVEHGDDARFAARIAGADDAMTPWPGFPASVATGILDDVTYDWKTVLRHQLRTGGWPVLVDEDDFVRATDRLTIALAGLDPTLPRPDATGAAGFAGYLVDPHRRHDDGPAVTIVSGRARS